MAKLSGTLKSNIVIILAVLIIVLSIVLIYVQYNSLVNLRDEVAIEELALDTARAELTRLMGHRDRAPDYERRLEYARSKVPNRAHEEELLHYIHNLVERYEMRAVEIRFADRVEDEETGYVTMPLSITVEGEDIALRREGEYIALCRLFESLYKGDRAVRVDDINISRAGGGNGLRVRITAGTFYNP